MPLVLRQRVHVYKQVAASRRVYTNKMGFVVVLFEMLLAIVTIILIFFIAWCRYRKKEKSVCIVVLGDIGRSPRMQYHAISFTKEGYTVEILGYPGSPPHQKLLNNPNVKFYYLREPPKKLHER